MNADAAPGARSSTASDHALARKAGLGDRAAFQELFDRLFPATLRYATRLLDGDERAAEDAIEICEEYGSKAVCARPKPSCDSDIMG